MTPRAVNWRRKPASRACSSNNFTLLARWGAIHANALSALPITPLVKLAEHGTKAATDAADARWFPISKAPKLAFDHADILAVALARLKGKVRYQPHRF